MNIVKGVADLLRRSSGGQSGEGGAWAHPDRPPSPRIRFGDTGEEATLSTLWQRYENAIDKIEKRKLLQVFLLHFIQTYNNWEPVNNGQLMVQQASETEDIIVGCSSGHPSEVILVLIQEIARITSLISEFSSTGTQFIADSPESSMSFSTEGLYVLNCLTIISRSAHNCRVFSYYRGVQKITALLKASVIRLKTLTSAVAVDEQLSTSSIEATRILQKILVYVVLIISGFMDLHSVAHKNIVYVNTSKNTLSRDDLLELPSSCRPRSISEARLRWQQKAIVLVMETGGVNWLVELLRVIRRLNLKEQWTDLSLQYLTLGTLRSALSENPRAQNHFRSIGGLEVLLDGLGFPSSKHSVLKTNLLPADERNRSHVFEIFQLQILSMDVLRESIFGNIGNLQFLCENGRIHKLANSICWPAFVIQEFRQQRVNSSVLNSQMARLNSSNANPGNEFLPEFCIFDTSDSTNLSEWNEYAVKLSKSLCSFLLAPEDIKFHLGQASICESSLPVSCAYWELSIRWVMKILQTVFPCIKACSNETKLPNHIRILANTMQHYILCAFRKVLVTIPKLLDVFREEGIWDFIFSEKFFYFGPSPEEPSMEFDVHTAEIVGTSEVHLASERSKCQEEYAAVDILQVEAISFLEFAATLRGNANNLPECSVLLDTLEQSACNPEVASILLKSLHRILQLSVEQSFSSFNSLNAIARILKIACIQSQEFRKFNGSHPQSQDDYSEYEIESDKNQSASSFDSAKDWVSCMQTSLDIFTEYLSPADSGRCLVLHDANCIDCLFDLFWEENLQKHVLEHILGLLKLPPSPEDRMAKLYICSKYLEIFTRAKEREKHFAELIIDLLIRMREILLTDQVYYQKLFCDGECFLHIVSLLNGNLDERIGEQLVLNVLQTLTSLLTGNDESKAVFRALVGVGYRTLQSLLLDFCKWEPSEGLLIALLDMLVDGEYEMRKSAVIKNEDVIILFLNVLQKCSASLQQYGLDILLNLLKDSVTNRTSCSRAGVLSFLLDWFSHEESEDMISRVAQLIQVVGGYSISGKDIRRIFALLRSDKIGARQNHGSLLLASIRSMLKERGPEAFFEFSGFNSGIVIKTPLQWPCSKGFSFSCWVRVENFPEIGMMGLFCFLTDNGRGCWAMLGKEKLIFESINQKRQCVSMPLALLEKQWHFLCITQSVGRTFSGGSLLRCYVDGSLVSSEKCRYAKVSDVLTQCTIGVQMPSSSEENHPLNVEKLFPFLGQIGPIYMFGDALSSEQVKGIYCLGPSYMYSFLGDEVLLASDISLYNSILDAKDGLLSKIIFGLNAQASDGRNLLNVLSLLDNSSDKHLIEATILDGTQLCSRRLLQEIIYCVGGVSVFFPLLTQLNRFYQNDGQNEYISIRSIMTDKLAAEVIELIASVLEGNLANQQQMHLLSGFSILGFLFQSVPPQQLNKDTLSALKSMFGVLRSCGLSKLLVKDAISRIYMNPHIWVYASYEVQRDLFMFLIQYFENDRSFLVPLCGLPRIIDMICQFYWDKADSQCAFGRKPLMHSETRQIIGERPALEEVRKIRLLLLSLAEMCLRQNVSAPDVKALIAFFKRSQDMACIEDVLHMVIRALSHKPLLASFLEQVNFLGGCHIFVNLLQRELEPIRLLGLQFMGKLLVGLPSEKKGTKFLTLSVGRSKSISEIHRKGGTLIQPIFSAISERLFKFPLSDHLCATLFDVLLGGASPKQVLQKRGQPDMDQYKRSSFSGFSSHFFLPQILECIFKFMSLCEDNSAREKILTDLLDLLVSSPSNIEDLMEFGWSSWLATSVRLSVINDYDLKSEVQANNSRVNELALVRNLFCVVLSHYICSVKGGWHQLEETVNFLLLCFKQGVLLNAYILRNIFEDLVAHLVEISTEENIFISQPFRDNTLYFLKLIDEMLISQSSEKLFRGIGFCPDNSLDHQQPAVQKDIICAVNDILFSEADNHRPRIPWTCNLILEEGKGNTVEDAWWSFYDKIWVLISGMNGKGPSKMFPKGSTTGAPSFGQRARGLVESLNIPAAEMAAVVVSGGIGNALAGKATKQVDKAMLLRGEKCPRIVFHLVILYLCKAGLERASSCVQQFISLLPSLFTSDDDQSRNRLHFFLWSLLTVRSHYGTLDDGARFHIISHLILETVNCAKSMLATSILGRDDLPELSSNIKEAGSILNLIQKDRILATVADEAKYMKITSADRRKQLQELHGRLDDHSAAESNQKKVLEDETQFNLNAILSSDDSRKSAFQLAYDEEQQIVAEKWIHMFRALVDERGPWSSSPLTDNTVIHWKLDKTEDNWRRRSKLKRNYHFNEQLCHPPTTKACCEANHPASEHNAANSSHVPDQIKRFLLKGVRGITEEGSSEPGEDPCDLATLKDPATGPCFDNSQLNQSVKECKDQTDIMQNKKDYSAGTPDSESNEVQLSISCVLVAPKRKLAGHLFILQNVLHFSGEFLVDGTGGSSVFTNFDALRNSGSRKFYQMGDIHSNKLVKGRASLEVDRGKINAADNIDADESVQNQHSKIKRHRRWNISKIKAVHWTRYLLQYTAIEIFFNDSVAPVFLNFSSPKDAKHVGQLIVSSRNELLFPKGSSRDKNGLIFFVDRRVAIEMAEIARERWRRRELNNFEYLMILNTLAGRSYNDLTQYPVFPWVLSDYSSDNLDFNKSSTFRDLSKPVGALDSKRFQVFEDRYRNFCDPDIPSFYYGSHYSSMGIVLFYLLRLEPFTTLHRNLQGGKFDHADRLFQSIEGTYKNCLSNTSDVKELIPEFFYMPEFLVNSNLYHLGVKQDGEPLADVSLPPWAKGSAEEFIYRNREALESEYVSSNLHHWIDLVFGYKQRGKPAVEAANVFYYLTYEGAVDLDTMDDLLQRCAIEDQIANFGQTPIQIFRKKHPRRGPPIPIAHPLYFAPASIALTSIFSNTSNFPSPVLFVGLVDSNIVIVNQGLTLSVKLWLTTQLQSGGNFTFSGSQDPLFAIGSDVLPPRKIGTPLAENIEFGSQCLATMQSPYESYLISCGNWENIFQVISLNDGRAVQSIRQHKDVVSCVAVTSDGRIIATGSFDTTVMVWHASKGRSSDKKLRSAQAEFPRKDYVIIENPVHILCGHDDIITCLFISLELDIVISGSKDGTCIFHTLREGRYVRSIQHPSGCGLSKLVASQHGRLVLYAENDLSLHMYTINGKHIAFSESNGRLNCIELSSCGDFLVCAGDHGQIVVRSMHSLAIVRRYEGTGKIITSLAVTPEECFLAGTKDGSLLVYSIENPQLRKGSISRSARSKSSLVG